MPKTQQEIVRQGYQVLVESLGVVDALKFIQYFSPGQGDYTEERHTWLDKTALDDVLEAMKQPEDSNTRHYDEIIEQSEILSLGSRLMTNIPLDTQKTLDVLRQVALATLERKRRLGHYAVVWRNGKPVAIGEDAPDDIKEVPKE